MYRILKRQEIDLKAWAQCVNGSKNASLYGMPWFMDSAAGKWKAIVKNDYAAVFPIIETTKYAMPFAYQPAGLHLLTWYGEAEMSDYNYAIDYLAKHYAYVEINLDGGRFHDGLLVQYPKLIGTKKLQTLNLDKDNMQEILGQLSKRHFSSIKKAQKHEIEIYEIDTYDSFKAAAIQSEAAKSMKIFDRKPDRIKRIVENSISEKKGQLWCAYLKGQAISTALFIKSHNKLYLQFIFANPDGLKHCANHLIMAHVIEHNLPNVEMLDFGGSNIPSIGHFNRGFGAVDIKYLQLKTGRLKGIIKR